MKWIRGFKDLADYFGVENIEDKVSRHLYRETNCGAWLKYMYSDKRRKNMRVHVLLNPHADDTVSAQSYKYGGQWNKTPRDWKAITDWNSLPVEIAQFLGMVEGQPHNKLESVSWKKLNRWYTAGAHCPFTLHKTVMTFFVEVEETYNREGVRIGTIVEGADAEPEVGELWFPFTTEVLRAEIQRIEDEADEIWQEWNNDKIRRLLRLS